jgi:hypothetical protein
MNVREFRKILAPAGQEALRAAAALEPSEPEFLAHFDALKRQYPPELARLALEIAILRREAQSKFPFASQLYFTRPALEQASSYTIAAYRSQRYAGFQHIADLGCSVGSDTLALASRAPTIGIDLDPVRLAMAQANLACLSLPYNASLLQADLTQRLPLAASENTGLFFDPARRSGERRLFSVREYIPPLNIIEEWLLRFPALGVKISPGVNLEQLSGYRAEIEFISLGGELKEAALWFGPLKTCHRRATLLPGEHSLLAITESPLPAGSERRLPLSEPLSYLYEPDPAILRAGLVQLLGEQLSAAQLDPDIAYLTSDRLVETPFARAWRVEFWIPFGIKRLRQALRLRSVTDVIVKKRGSPLQPEELIHNLRLEHSKDQDSAQRVLFLTHLRGRPIVVICFANL